LNTFVRSRRMNVFFTCLTSV